VSATFRSYCSLADWAWASFRMEMSGAASFQKVRKSLQAARGALKEGQGGNSLHRAEIVIEPIKRFFEDRREGGRRVPRFIQDVPLILG